MDYICHKCGARTNAELAIFSNKIYLDIEEMKNFRLGRIQNYYSDYFITWICSSCNSVNLNRKGISKPISLIPTYQNAELNKYLEHIEDKNLKILISDFFKCIGLELNSPAVMIGRKILMHIAVVETNCEENKNFVYYVEQIDNSSLLGNKWKPKLDLLRKLGNEENHELKIASNEDANLVKEIMIGLIQNIYM